MTAPVIPVYRIVEDNQADLRLKLQDEVIATLPDTIECAAELRRLAEDHAGHELDWRGRSWASVGEHRGQPVRWLARSVDNYTPAPGAT